MTVHPSVKPSSNHLAAQSKSFNLNFGASICPAYIMLTFGGGALLPHRLVGIGMNAFVPLPI